MNKVFIKLNTKIIKLLAVIAFVIIIPSIVFGAESTFTTSLTTTGFVATPTPTPTPTATPTPTPTTPSGGGGSGGGGGSQIIITDLFVIAGTDKAMVTFKTNQPTATKLTWGLGGDYELGSLVNGEYTKDHSFTITGLNPATLYKFKVFASIASGAEVNKESQFTTLAQSENAGPLPNPTDFKAEAREKDILLSWVNPTDPRFNDVRIVRTEGFYPIDQFDGDPIYEGDEQSFVDTSAKPGVTYYYAIFARDREGNYSSGALAQARIALPGELATSTIADPFANIPEASNVDPRFKSLRLADFEFLQDGKLLASVENNTVAIHGDKNLTIRLKSDKVPPILKTIAFTLKDPDDKNKVFPFLLRINKDKTYYEATIGALGKSGRYGMSVAILDYENNGLVRLNGTLAALSFMPFLDLNNAFDFFGLLILFLLILLIILAILAIRRWMNRNDDEEYRSDKQSFWKFGKKQIVASAIVLVSLFGFNSASAAFNNEINYQGKLSNSLNAIVTDGNYNIRFKLYTTQTGGAPIWTETLCNTSDCAGTGAGTDNRVSITNGLFSVMLGSTSPLTGVDFNQTLYLGVEIGGSGAVASWDGEMSPRKVLGAVPAAFIAENANALSGLNSSQFLRSDATNSTSTSSTFLSIVQNGAGKVAEFFGSASQSVLALLSNGNVGIGTTTPYAKLSVAGEVVSEKITATSTSATSTLPNLSITNLKLGSDFVKDITGNGLSVTNGSLNVTGLTSTGNANMVASYDSSGNLVATSTPQFSSIIATSSTETSTFAGALSVGGSNGLNALSNGYVGIGTDNPGAKLDVQGNAYIQTSLGIGADVQQGQLRVAGASQGLMYLSQMNADSDEKNWYFDAEGGDLYWGANNDTFSGGSNYARVARTGSSVDSFEVMYGSNNQAWFTQDAAGIQPYNVTPTAHWHIRQGSNLAGNAPLKIDAGPLLNTPEAGAVEYQNDKWYLTIDTGPARKEFALNDKGLSQDRIPFVTTNGRFTDDANFVYSSGNLGIGTTTPSQALSVGGNILGNKIIGSYFVATSTTASVLPYASTTAITVSGTNGLQLATGLNGPLQANNGLVSATTSIGVVYGGTGATTFGQGWIYTDGGTGALNSSTSPTVNYITATSTTATSSFAGGVAITKGLNIGSGYIYGAGLQACANSADKLTYDATTGKFGCGTDAGAGGGITSLAAQYSPLQTGAGQTFATSSDTNIALTITSNSDIHTFTPSWVGTLAVGRGGTGLSSAPTYGQLLLGNASNGYTLSATSSLGIALSDTTGTLAANRGGTGISSTPTYGQILVGNASNGYDLLSTSSLNIQANLANITGTLGVANGGTGATTFGQGWIYTDGGTGALNSSTSPTVNYITATSTTATSTFNGGLVAGGSGSFRVLQNGNIGIGTTSPASKLELGTGQFYIPNGLRTAPAIAFSNDTNTGIYLEGADQLGFAAGGNLQFYASASGIAMGTGKDFNMSATSYLVWTDTNLYRGGANQLKTDDDFASVSTGSSYFMGSLGVGTSSPYAKLSVAGQVVGQYFTATSTTIASTFPYASTTAITVSGTNGLQLATGLNGPLQANNGLVSATTSIGVVYGGTGLSSAPTYGQILVGNASNGYDLLSTSSLNIQANLANITGTLGVANGGTGATTFGQGWIYTDGGTGALNSSTSPTVNYITATSTTATSTFLGGLVAGTNGITVLQNGKVGISSSTPSAELAVAGTIYTSGKVRAGGANINYESTGVINSTQVNSGLSNPANAGSSVAYNQADGYWQGSGSHSIRVYAYRLVDGITKVFSSGFSQSATTSPSGTQPYVITWTWDAVVGADGYRVLIQEPNYNGCLGYYSCYADVPTNSLVDDSYEVIYASSTLPSIYNGALTIRGDQSVSGSINFTNTDLIKFDNLPLLSISTSTSSFAFGLNTLQNSTGKYNTAIGTDSLYRNTTGYSNTAIGNWSLYGNISGYSNVGVGGSSLVNNTTGYENVAVGFSSLAGNTTGLQNVAIGKNSMYANTTGSFNTAVGPYSLSANTIGSRNSAFGLLALGDNTSGSLNVAVGDESLFNNTTGSSTVSIGFRSAFGTTGSVISSSTIIGTFAGKSLTTASNNILIGSEAGDAITSGSNNIVIGTNIDAPSNTASNQLNIANIIFGVNNSGTGSTISTGNIGIGTTSPYAKLSVVGETVSNYFTATSTTASSTLPNVIATNLRLNGILYDTNNASGTNGYVLQTTGSGVQWVSTSSLNIAGGSGVTGGTTGMLTAWTGATTLTATGTPTAASYFATSTTATSTFLGGLSVGGASGLYSFTNGRTSLASTSPWAQLSINPDGITGPAFAIGSSTATNFVVTSAGFVGIGTTSPASRLNIEGPGLESALILTDSNYSAGYGSLSSNIFIQSDNGVLSAGTTNKALTATTSLMKITSDGNVRNVALGIGAMANNIETGSDNVAIGYNVLSSNTSGLRNTGIGYGTLGNNTVGQGNIGIGGWSVVVGTLGNNTSGSNNLALGVASMAANTIGSENISLGKLALGSNQVSSYNIALGTSALYANTATGSIAIGYQAGDALTTGSYNTIIGYDVDAPSDTDDNQLNIGNIIFGTSIDGRNKTISSGKIGIGTTSPYAKLSVAGQVVGQYFTATSTTASSTLPNVVATNLRLSGILYDTNNASGTNGYVLQTTGSGVQWVSTSSLNITAAASGGANFGKTFELGTDAFGVSALSPTTTVPLYITSSATSSFLGGIESWSKIAAPYFNATSTTATSTFLGGLSVGGASGLYSFTNGRTSLASTSPWAQLSINPDGITGPAFAIGSSTATNFIVTNGGNVGVGTTSPAKKFAVSGPIYAIGDTTAGLYLGDPSDSNSRPRIVQNGPANIALYNTFRDNNTAKFSWGYGGSGTSPASSFFISRTADFTSPDFLLTPTGVTALGLLGNVGIATTTPNNSLDIYSTTKSAIGFSGASGSTYKWTLGMDVTNSGRFSIASSTALGTSDRFVIDGNGNVGIGTTSPDSLLALYSPAQASTRESLLRTRIADGGNSLFEVTNSTVTNGFFVPTLAGYVDSSNTSNSLEIRGLVSAANDASDSANSGIVAFTAMRTSSASNPNNGTFSNPQNRKLFSFNNQDTVLMTIAASGNVGIATSAPYAKLSVAGQVVGQYFTATSTTASIFPYASTTALTVAGTNGLQLASGLNGPLQAVNGLVSATSTLSVAYGGTGLSSIPTYGKLLVGNASGGYDLTSTSSLGILASSAIGAGTIGQLPYYASNGQAITATSSLFLSTAGYLGIGTTTPTSALSVFSTAVPQLQLAYDKDNYLAGSVSSSGGITFASNGTAGGFTFTNPQPTAVVSGTGTAAPYGLNVSGGIGGNSLDTNIGVGGVGGGIQFAGGAGGTAAASTFSETGGAGGVISITGGAGGAASSASVDFMTRQAGNGGQITLTSGAGGNASNGGIGSLNTAGNGGAFVLKAGAGGNASGATTNNGGNGGSLYVTGGAGGTGASQNGTAGNVFLGYDSINSIGNVYFGNQSSSFIGSTGNFGVGTSSPYAKLSVAGQVVGQYFTATSTTASSTLPNVIATNLRLNGILYDTNNASGTNGYVLQTTGSGVQWVSTSSLNIAGGNATLSGGTDGMLTAWSGASTVTATGTPTAGSYFATSTTATSTFLGGLSVGGTSGLYSFTNGRTSLASTSPWAQLSINPDGITGPSFAIGSSTATNFVVTNAGNIGIGTANPTSLIYANSPLGGKPILTLDSSGSTRYSVTEYGSVTFGGVSYGSFGTAVSPTYTFTSRTSDGIYSPDLNTLGFSTNGIERIRIDSAGNLGIGTSSPYAKLSVVGQTVAEYFTATSTTASSTLPNVIATNLRLNGILYDTNNASGTNGYVLQTTGSGVQWVSTSSLNITAAASGGANFGKTFELGTDAFGVSALSPTTTVPLYITSSATSSFLGGIESWSKIAAPYFHATSTTATSTFLGALSIGSTTPYSTSMFSVGTSSPLLTVNNSSGFVGIGTSNPQYALDVGGGVFTTTRLGTLLISPSGHTSAAEYISGNTNMSFGSRGSISMYIDSNNNDSTSAFLLYGNTSSSGNEVFRISDNGMVGISSTSPFAVLSISASTTNPGNIPLLAVSTTTASGTTTAFLITSMGKVGVGTTSPYAQLSVQGLIAGQYFNADATTSTSTLAGGLNVGSGNLVYDFTTGITSVNALETGNLNFDTDAGAVSWVDLPISSATLGTVESYAAQIAGTPVLTVYGLANGSGGVATTTVAIGTSSPYTNGLTVWGRDTIATTRSLDVVNNASTSLLTVFNGGIVKIGGSTSTTTINGYLDVLGTGSNSTSTFSSNLWVKGSIQQSGSATSTFANGIQLTNGCFMMPSGSCLANGVASISGGQAGKMAFWTAADTLSNNTYFSWDNTNMMLGVGTSTPAAILSVTNNAGTSANTPLFMIASTTADNSTSTLMVVTASGNVGIGTTSPFGKLAVDAGVTSVNTAVNASGSINDFLQFDIKNTSSGTGAQAGYSATADNGTLTTNFAWMGINNSNFYNPQVYNVGGALDVSFMGSGNDMYVANAIANKKLHFMTGGTATTTNIRMTIDGNGKVGIGSTSPNYALDVNGDVNVATGKCFRVDGVCIGYVVKLVSVFASSSPGNNSSIVATGAVGSSPSFSGTTLTLPSNTSYYVAELWGGGGGGGASSTAATDATSGGNSCFGPNATACTSPYATAGGGGPGLDAAAGDRGAGGTATVISTDQIGINGYPGHPGSATAEGGMGGSAPRGGTGGFATTTTTRGGFPGNSPGGGGAGGRGSATVNGGGGGGGAYVQVVSTSTATRYFTIGVGGTGGRIAGVCAVTTSGCGGNGADGGMVISVYATSSPNAAGTDYAEMFPVSNSLIGPGDIVSVDAGLPVSMKYAEQGDLALAGVVATKPGQILGDEKAIDQRPIALSGRVPVKVNLEGGVIRPGDRIAISSVRGVGKKAGPLEASVGIALDSFDGEEQGTVMMFVNIQQNISVKNIGEELLKAPTDADSYDFVGNLMKVIQTRYATSTILGIASTTSTSTIDSSMLVNQNQDLSTLDTSVTATSSIATTSTATSSNTQALAEAIVALDLKVDAFIASSTLSYDQVIASTTSALASSTSFINALASSTASVLTNDQTFIQSLTNSMKNALASATDWVVEKFTAKVAYINRIEAETVAVSKGMEIVDQTTGAVWCVTIKNGDWNKVQGACANVASTTQLQVTPTPSPLITPSITPVITPPTSTSTEISSSTDTTASTTQSSGSQNSSTSTDSTSSASSVGSSSTIPSPSPSITVEATPAPTSSPESSTSPSTSPVGSADSTTSSSGSTIDTNSSTSSSGSSSSSPTDSGSSTSSSVSTGSSTGSDTGSAPSSGSSDSSSASN